MAVVSMNRAESAPWKRGWKREKGESHQPMNVTDHSESWVVKSEQPTRPMTPKQAAAYLGLDVKTITRWARQGYMPAHPLGEGKRRFWRFFENELLEWLAAKNNRSAA
jgi:excisionase family DNA binding protein